MPKSEDFEFAIWHFLGLPIVMTRHAVPHWSDSPGRFQWSRWRPASFGNAHYANQKLRELNKNGRDV